MSVTSNQRATRGLSDFARAKASEHHERDEAEDWERDEAMARIRLSSDHPLAVPLSMGTKTGSIKSMLRDALAAHRAEIQAKDEGDRTVDITNPEADTGSETAGHSVLSGALAAMFGDNPAPETSEDATHVVAERIVEEFWQEHMLAAEHDEFAGPRGWMQWRLLLTEQAYAEGDMDRVLTGLDEIAELVKRMRSPS